MHEQTQYLHLQLWTDQHKWAKKRKILDPKKMLRLSVERSKIHGSIQSIKALVTYFKRTKLNSKLSVSLKQEVPTKWNSQLLMLESYVKSSEQVKRILLERGSEEKVADIDDATVKEICDFLEPIRKAQQHKKARRRRGGQGPEVPLIKI